jgi:hypothetical protein
MEEWKITEENQESADRESFLSESIKSLKEKIELIKLENKEFFDQYKELEEEAGFVMQLAHDYCLDSRQEMITRNKRLLLDYLANDTVAGSAYLDETYNSSKTIEMINLQFKEGLDATQGTDEPFNKDFFQSLSKKNNMIQKSLDDLEKEIYKKQAELSRIKFLKEKDLVLEKNKEYFEKYKDLHIKFQEAKTKIENRINELLQPYFELGMTMESAITVYNQQPDSEYLKNQELYIFKKIILEIEEVLLDLEIHREQIQKAEYVNYKSSESLYDTDLRRKLQNESFLYNITHAEGLLKE